MPIEKQCTSLELSKRLKELGLPQQSIFIWKDGKVLLTKVGCGIASFSAEEMESIMPEFTSNVIKI